MRDVNVKFKGGAYPVALDSVLLASGWQGGQGVMWAQSPKDEFLVTRSDGRYGGFLLWGSNEDSDQHVSFVQQQLVYGHAILCTGGWLMSTRTFETHTYASRLVPPLVPIVYTPGEGLRFSLRGFFTNEDEWTASGDPRAPNGFYLGRVVQVPTLNEIGVSYLTIQTSL